VVWQTSRFAIDLAQPRVMGIVNVTPDSFSDGGAHASTDTALKHCEQLLKEGADILDIGGESTRPGSPAVPLDAELARVLPVVREAAKLNVPLSIDTYKPEVMRAVLDLGADIVNDIWALRQPGALEAVAAHPSCGICLMHMHRDPQTMQATPMDGDVIPEVLAFWAEQVARLCALQIDPSRITLDPGVGFGKTVAQNFALLGRQR
jgi:dihydropteroate synthase